MIKTIEKNVSAEIVEKKSKFIANLIQVHSKEEAEARLNEIRKTYRDARHNCFAYVVDDIEKCSDDGEPSGTAGQPMLALLKGKELDHVLIIVTRYFGGILLGTGGLVRAYTSATNSAIEKANIITKEKGLKFKIEIKYEDLNRVQYLCDKLNVKILDTKYGSNISMILASTEENKHFFESETPLFIHSEVIAKDMLI